MAKSRNVRLAPQPGPTIKSIFERGPTRYISTALAAKALGVGVSTVKRWVDEGILLAALLSGDSVEVRALIRRAYLLGNPIETLADRVIAPVMEKVGHEWQAAQIDVWHEHRGTQLLVAALGDLKAVLEARTHRKRPVALGGAPAGDPYLLATLLAELTLLDAGWEAVNLGPNTPFCSFTNALKHIRPQLVWLSVSHMGNTNRFLAGFSKFYQAAEQAGAAVVAGGRALVERVRTRMPYATYGDGLTNLATFARALHTRPQRPRRGRPRSGASQDRISEASTFVRDG